MTDPDGWWQPHWKSESPTEHSMLVTLNASSPSPRRSRDDVCGDLLDAQPALQEVFTRIPDAYVETIITWMQSLGRSQEEAAIESGISQSSVSYLRSRAIQAVDWSRRNQPQLTPLEVFHMLQDEFKHIRDQRTRGICIRRAWTLAWVFKAWVQVGCPSGLVQRSVYGLLLEASNGWILQSRNVGLPAPLRGFFEALVAYPPPKPARQPRIGISTPRFDVYASPLWLPPPPQV